MQANIYQIIPFDAAVGTIIRFSWNGNQVFKNRCIIREDNTNQIVYDNTVDNFKYEHIIDLSKATLENGMRYNAYITVFDKDNVESEIQQLGMPFLCLKTPVFEFVNIVDGQVIESSSYQFSLTYSQENGELLDSWSMGLYTKSHVLLSSTGVNYNTDTLTHVFSGFSDKNEYLIRGIGKTVNGMELDTGYINLSVTYDIQDLFSLLELNNLSKQGAIHIRSNIITAEGYLKNTPGVYIDNEYLDLRDNEITYNEGFLFNGDFSVVTLFYGMQPNDEIMLLSSENPNDLMAIVSYRIGKFGKNTVERVFELKIISNGISSVFYSNTLPLQYEDDKFGLCISRKDGLYNIEATILSTGSELGKVWQKLRFLSWNFSADKQWGYFTS